MPRQIPPHVHKHDDGRGPRRVLLNGREVKRVRSADEKRGVVECCHDPLRLDKHKKRILAYRRYGAVVVEPMSA